MAKKTQVFNSLLDFGLDAMKQMAKQIDNVKVKRPRIQHYTAEQVTYNPNQSFKTTINVPDKATETLKDLNQTINNLYHIKGIDNIDTMFEQAESMSALGADNAAKQFVSSGLSDASMIARGMSPTSFKYKAHTTSVPRRVWEERVIGEPVETIDYLTKLKPELQKNYLELFRRMSNGK